MSYAQVAPICSFERYFVVLYSRIGLDRPPLATVLVFVIVSVLDGVLMEPTAGVYREQLDTEDYQAQAGFRYAIRRFVHTSEEYARAAGVTPQQHLLLLMLRGHPAYPLVTIKDLADQLQIRHHSASLLVDRSVKRGLLARTPDTEDRRKVRVTLTDEGLRLLEQISIANRAELRALDHHFNDMQHSLLRAFRNAVPDARLSRSASDLMESLPLEQQRA